MPKFTIKGEMPASLVPEFIELLREFELYHPQQVELAMLIELPNTSVKEAEVLIGNVKPPFPFKQIFHLKD